MRKYFITNGLSIRVYRDSNTKELMLTINSEFSGTEHKGTIRPNKEKLTEHLERLWKSIKTKKLQSIRVSFDEIDWYDDCESYETPNASIKRGLRKAVISHSRHYNIPKDWEITLEARISDTSTSTPIMEVVEKTLGHYFTPELQKKFKKELTPVLQKKKEYCSVENPWESKVSNYY